MDYMATKNRCAVSLDNLKLPFSRDKILSILESKGFSVLDVDIIMLARQYIGVAQYRRGARIYEAPRVFDCSSFIKWLYANRGIWLPRRSIQQREFGEKINLNELIAGDVIFVSGYIDYYQDNPADGVGHVGIYSGQETVIHADNKRLGIVETPIDKFIGKSKFRGARRYLPKNLEVITFGLPSEREIETADDFRWVVLQSLPRK